MNGIESDRPALAIGTAGLDMVGRIQQEPEKGTSSPASIRVNWGGVARNVAENLARLGQPVALLSAAICVVASIAAWTARETYNIPMHDLGSHTAAAAPPAARSRPVHSG
jgi:hypothetical protein